MAIRSGTHLNCFTARSASIPGTNHRIPGARLRGQHDPAARATRPAADLEVEVVFGQVAADTGAGAAERAGFDVAHICFRSWLLTQATILR